MVYFPQNVFKNIISFARSPHPVARMLESELGVWMLSLRLNTDAFTGDVPQVFRWNRQKIFDGFFDPCYPHAALSNNNTIIEVYKQRFAGARRGWYTDRPTILTKHKDRRLFYHCVRWDSGDFNNKVYVYEAHLNPYHFGDKQNITNKDMIKYLKENGIKGYSKKKRKELISMCISF